jgi:hypothetical protein
MVAARSQGWLPRAALPTAVAPVLNVLLLLLLRTPPCFLPVMASGGSAESAGRAVLRMLTSPPPGRPADRAPQHARVLPLRSRPGALLRRGGTPCPVFGRNPITRAPRSSPGPSLGLPTASLTAPPLMPRRRLAMRARAGQPCLSMNLWFISQLPLGTQASGLAFGHLTRFALSIRWHAVPLSARGRCMRPRGVPAPVQPGRSPTPHSRAALVSDAAVGMRSRSQHAGAACARAVSQRRYSPADHPSLTHEPPSLRMPPALPPAAPTMPILRC